MANIFFMTWAVLAVTLAGAIIAAVGTYAWTRRKRSEQLQILFGPEYDRAVRLYGDRNRAETALESRRKRLQELGVHELSESERDKFLIEWAAIQTSSKDPSTVLIEADNLLTQIMRAEGCPASDPDERRVDLALMHPSIADDFRTADDVLDRYRLGIASPEEIRHAQIRYSNVFESILGHSDLRDRLRQAS